MITGLVIRNSSNGLCHIFQSNRYFRVGVFNLCETINKVNKIKKKERVWTKITLISQNNVTTVTTLNEAQKIAKRRDLFLIQVKDKDIKTERPLYKLTDVAEILEDEVNDITSEDLVSNSAHKRIEKSLTINSRISEHDLSSRLNQITKWLQKGREIRILIHGQPDNLENSEKIIKAIEHTIKGPESVGKILQKRNKGANVNFSIIPIAKPETIA